jgi:sulfoxide reductase heme-binding subunit YedZ
MKTLNNKAIAWLKISVFLLALIPFFKLGISGYLDNLGANPIEKITHRTGYWTLSFLLITLTITPLRRLTGWLWLVRLRRMLGLFAFFYGCLHFSTYLVLDQFFDWDNIVKDIVKRPYITVGFSAFVLLIPLAITSNNRIIKLIGGKQWRLLHRAIYPIAIGGVVHYWWLVKKDITQPLIFALLLSILLAARLFYGWRGFVK